MHSNEIRPAKFKSLRAVVLGLLVGAVLGAAIGVSLAPTEVPKGARDRAVVIIAFVVAGSLLGVAIGARLIRASGWATIAGAAIGGLLSILMTGVGKAAIYGAPMGAAVGLLCGLAIEARRRSNAKHENIDGPNERATLLARYPSHLALIDSRRIPATYDRGPDLSYLTESARFYYDLIRDSAPHLKDKPRAVTDAEREMASVANNRIVNAEWGLIARGFDAVPFALKLLASSDRDLREAGAAVFTGLRDPSRLDEVVNQVTATLDTEQDRLVIDTLLGALGNLRSRQTIPTLKRFIVSETEDSDTRWEAAMNLGRIVGKRFEKDGADAVEAARNWLKKHENK